LRDQEIPKQVFCDRDLMKLLIKLVVSFSDYYPNIDKTFLRIEGKNLERESKLVFKMGAVSFLDHPSFSPNRPLKRIGNIKTSKASGYELVIINQIVKLHRGSLKISINNVNETEIELNLPNL